MRITIVLAALLAAGLSGATYAEGPAKIGSKEVAKNEIRMGVPSDVEFVTAHEFLTAQQYESMMADLLKKLNEASQQAAVLARDSNNTLFRGDADNIMRIVKTAESIFDNTLAVVEKYAEKDPVFKKTMGGKLSGMRSKIGRLNAYHFGPDRESFTIELVSNEGKGDFELPNGRVIRYAVAPGLRATPIDEREVHAIERFPDGTYKIALGIMYRGQETVEMHWDPRPYSYVGYHLDYHNVTLQKTPDIYLWLSNGPLSSTPVPFSENKTAANASKITAGKSVPSSTLNNMKLNHIKKTVDCDCDGYYIL